MECKYIFCIDCPVRRPIPKIITDNIHLFKRVRKVLDIGAGRGRFIPFFKKLAVEKYIAVEPCTKFARNLKELLPEGQVIEKPWQEVRSELLQERWDVIIAWNVGMFLDLRKIHKTSSFKSALIREIAEWIVHSRILLLSFHPVKNGLPEISGWDAVNPRAEFDKIVHHALNIANREVNALIYDYRNMQYIIVNYS